MEITHTTTVDAPAERVWSLTLDLEALPRLTPTVTAIERLDDGPVQVGSRARLAQPGLGRRVWTVQEVDPPHRFVWSTRLLGTRMAGVHEVTPTGDDRCELTLRVVLDGPAARLIGLGRRSIARSLAAEAQGFATAATALPA